MKPRRFKRSKTILRTSLLLLSLCLANNAEAQSYQRIERAFTAPQYDFTELLQPAPTEPQIIQTADPYGLDQFEITPADLAEPAPEPPLRDAEIIGQAEWQPPFDATNIETELRCPRPETADDCRATNFVLNGCLQKRGWECSTLLGPEYETGATGAVQVAGILPARIRNDSTIQAMALSPSERNVGVLTRSLTSYTAVRFERDWLGMDRRAFELPPEDQRNFDVKVTSCRDYAYNRHYDYEKALETVALCGEDDECAYDAFVATIGGALEGRLLYQNDPARTEIGQEPGKPSTDIRDQTALRPAGVFQAIEPVDGFTARPKNPFFAHDLTFLRDRSRYTTDADYAANVDRILERVERGRAYYARTGSWTEAADRMQEQRAIGLTKVERADIDERRHAIKNAYELFDAVLAKAAYTPIPFERNQMTLPEITMAVLPSSPTVPALQEDARELNGIVEVDREKYGIEDPTFELKSPYDRAADEIYELLLAELGHHSLSDGTPDEGCLNLGDSRCDFSLSEFLAYWKSRYAESRERDYAECLDYAGDDDLGRVPAQYKENIQTLRAWFELEKAAVAEVAQEIAPYRAGMGPDTIGQHKEGRFEIGIPGKLGAGYYFNHSWRISAERAPGSSDVCHLAGEASATVGAFGDLLGKRYEAVEASFGIGASKNTAELHAQLKVAGKQLLPPLDFKVKTELPFNIEPPELAGEVSTMVLVFGVPVTIKAFAEVRYGAKVVVGVNAVSPECNVQDVELDLSTSFEPWARVEGGMAVGIGVPGFNFGISGNVELVQLHLPLTAKVGIHAHDGMGDLVLGHSAGLEVSTLSGHLDVYVDAIVRSKQTFFDWPGIHAELPFWDVNHTIPLFRFDRALLAGG